VIQDTASTATLVALLTAREKASGFKTNEKGFTGDRQYRIYCSTEAHSSIEKAAKMAGIGKKNLVKIEVDESLAILPDKLLEAVEKDLDEGRVPLCVVAAIGTTGTAAIDPLEPLAGICSKYGIWLHVDAAYAGTALVLPEQRWMIRGIEGVDSFVFNPHKWMFTNFDCSAYFVRDTEVLIRTFEILPEYLRTGTRGQVNDYRDWGIQLGRRFRALKLWFVIRDFGVEGIRNKVRDHLSWAGELARQIKQSSDFELFEPQNMGLVCFRYQPPGESDAEKRNRLNEKLMQTLNASGRIYLTHTKVEGLVTLRLVVGQTNVTRKHVQDAWKLIRETAREIEGNQA
jgi:aromatic-L-amino-acid decarboxylase